MLLFNLLHCGERALTALLSVQGQGDRNRLRSSAANDVERLAHGSACGDDVIDYQNTTVQGSADHLTALTMVLRFLAVERVGHIEIVVLDSATTVAVASGIPL